MVNLRDNAGETIWSSPGWWYKIALADGTELGLGDKWTGPSHDRYLLKVVPAGQGLVFRYQRSDGDNRGGQGWPMGDKGYLRGLQVQPDGTETIMNLSLSGDIHMHTPIVKLCGYDTHNSYGFMAEQLPGHRVLLYAYNVKGTVCGLRVIPDGTILKHESAQPMGLDCEFVRVSNNRFSNNF